jgi:microcystin-dependent protein
MSSYTRSRFTLGAHQKPIVGDTKTSVVGTDHMGWIKCDGRFLSKDEWYLLFRVIGYSFGQSGELFRLPNAGGTVPGIVGTGTDSNTTNQTFVLGQQVGEYTHRLTIDEMPTHNHGVEGDPQPTNNQTSSYTHSHGGSTSNAGTHAHTINDPGHTHTYLGVSGQTVGILGGDTAADEAERPTETTLPSATGITINTNGDHNHGITADTHFHTIIAAGGSNVHNNVQPTLPIGNLFIYSGRSQYPLGGFPYTAGTQLL